MDALEYLEMGDEAKMVMKFKKRFWPENAAFINRVDTKHEMCRTFHAPYAGMMKKQSHLLFVCGG